MEFSQQNSDLIGYGNIFGQNTFKKIMGNQAWMKFIGLFKGKSAVEAISTGFPP
jgi:hypothetical protein